MKRTGIIFAFLLILVFLSFILTLTIGSVHIPFSDAFSILFGGVSDNRSWPVILESRLSEAIVALVTGGSLAVCGLVLQGIFRNPLAGPGVLGVSSGAYFGVAVFIFLFQNLNGAWFAWGLPFFGVLGALFVLLLIVYIGTRTTSNATVLIAGLMLSYLFGSLVSILLSYAKAVEIQQFVIWGFGSFTGILYEDVWHYLIIIILPLFGFIFLAKPLNALLLGANYASTLGVNVKNARLLLFILTGIIVGIATAFCGPIAFIGMATPHILRFIYKSNNYFSLLPMVFLSGAFIALTAHFFTKYPVSLPLNAITSFIGAPVVIYLLFKKRDA